MKKYVVLFSLAALLLSGAISIQPEPVPPQPEPPHMEERIVPGMHSGQTAPTWSDLRALHSHLEGYFTQYSVRTLGINASHEIEIGLARFDRETMNALTAIAHDFNPDIPLHFLDYSNVEIRPTQV